jgi:hypothetical protein
MRKLLLPFLILALVLFSCNSTVSDESASDQDAERLATLKELAAMYHDLDPATIDSLLTEDFTGYGENGHTWDRESHRRFLSNGNYKVDSIIRQVAEGDWVCTHFSRTMFYQGDTLTVPAMHFKHFKGDKIFELWEYFDYDPCASEGQ